MSEQNEVQAQGQTEAAADAEAAGWNLQHTYATELPGLFYQHVMPASVKKPSTAVLNDTLARQLGLQPEQLQSAEGAEWLSGNRVMEGADPIAQAYAGHQFGHFTMLGDGRAILLGEQQTPDGTLVDIQLKGSGRTPYSRGGDGRAGIGPMLREYIISEAMHALGVPTTRSLAVVATGQPIVRESYLPGAVLTRVASSHLRVGTFEYAAQWGRIEDVRALADYAIRRHYPEAMHHAQPYLQLLQGIIERQAQLIAKWQLIGFVHGVMNTDNMTISGETIDYGPCAFMDTYNLATVFSSIDRQGRYAYGNQPYIASWNLTRLAETLVPLLHENQEEAIALAQDALDQFEKRYNAHWQAGMRAKLGLFHAEANDEALFQDLLVLMQKHQADYTNTFVYLTFDRFDQLAFANTSEFNVWREQWQERLREQPESKDEARQHMKRHNPAVIPRNHRVEEALAAAEEHGDYEVMHRLLAVLAEPYAHDGEHSAYAEVPERTTAYRTFCGT